MLNREAVTEGSTSRAVTVLGWFFMLANIAVIALALWVLALPQWSLPMREMAEALREAGRFGGFTAGAWWLVVNHVWVLAFVILASLITAVAAWFLLQRRPWARQLFVGLMVAGAVITLGAVAVTPLAFSFMAETALPEVDRSNPLAGLVGVLGGAIAAATLLTALFGWAAWKLTSPVIRHEFHVAKAQS